MDFKDIMINFENTGEGIYIIKEGNIPVLVSAPHTVNQNREDGSFKLAEPFTKAIALYLHDVLGCYVITKNEPNGFDDNRFNESGYRDAMVNLINKNNIKLVLDIHGASFDRDFDIELGTLNNLSSDYSTLYELIDSFNEEGILNVTKNEPFKGGAITQEVYSKTNADVIQIEINRKYRDKNDIEKLNKVCNSLIKFIHFYINVIN